MNLPLSFTRRPAELAKALRAWSCGALLSQPTANMLAKALVPASDTPAETPDDRSRVTSYTAAFRGYGMMRELPERAPCLMSAQVILADAFKARTAILTEAGDRSRAVELAHQMTPAGARFNAKLVTRVAERAGVSEGLALVALREVLS